MACTGVVEIAHPDNEIFGLLELGQFLLWVCAPGQGMVGAVGYTSRTLCLPKVLPAGKGSPQGGVYFQNKLAFCRGPCPKHDENTKCADNAT